MSVYAQNLDTSREDFIPFEGHEVSLRFGPLGQRIIVAYDIAGDKSHIDGISKGILHVVDGPYYGGVLPPGAGFFRRKMHRAIYPISNTVISRFRS